MAEPPVSPSGPAAPGAEGYPNQEQWHALLTGIDPRLRRLNGIFRHIPSDPRCKFCSAPFAGIGAPFMRALRRGRWTKSPRFCSFCFQVLQNMPGGTELDISLVFADVRGSTGLAERVGPYEFSRLINRFYDLATGVLIGADAILDKFVGDEVIGLFIPALAGPDHARKAVDAGRAILRVTGHGSPQGPIVPIGVGVHSGIAFVGIVGAAGEVTDFTALGDPVNTTARLASMAATGEVLVTAAAARAAGLATDGLTARDLEIRGRTGSVSVWVLGPAAT